MVAPVAGVVILNILLLLLTYEAVSVDMSFSVGILRIPDMTLFGWWNCCSGIPLPLPCSHSWTRKVLSLFVSDLVSCSQTAKAIPGS